MGLFFADYLDRLQRLHDDVAHAVEGLSQEALDWAPGPDMNSLCVLVVHLAGAERYWIGDVVGRDPSGRDRDAEFRARGVGAAALKARLADALAHSRGVLEELTLEDLEAVRVSPRDGREFSVAWALAHALEHTAIHVGHAQLVRQLWDQAGPAATFDVAIADHVIVFMDIHDYSIAANALGERQFGFLQAVYEGLGDGVIARGGEIIKYMGDALLCVFPAGSESQAVACGLGLRSTFSDLADEWGVPSDTELEVGISSGEVGIGVFGHRALRQKDVFGEVVNQAAVIGHHRGVAVTEDVREKVKAHYETKKLRDFEVKWRDEPLRVWEIVE
jgi:class 3 adenylate cyclase